MKKILIIRMSSIGDIVLATSFLESVKIKYPDSKIDFLIKKEFASIVENHPMIDNLIIFDKSKGWNGLMKLGKSLGKKSYYRVFDIHNVFRSKFLSYFFKRVNFFQISKPRLKRFLLFYFRLNFFKKDFSHIKMYHSLLGIKENFPRTSLYVSEDEKSSAKIFLQNHNIVDEFICIVPGAAWEQKQLPVNKYDQLIEDLLNKFNFKILILGSKNDTICDKIAVKDGVINLKNQTSLRMALSILSLAKHSFGSDTGLMHASEALNTPVSMILGPTSSETGATINHPQSIIFEKNNLWCRPCSQNGKRKCIRKEQYCLTGIKINDLVQAFEKSS